MALYAARGVLLCIENCNSQCVSLLSSTAIKLFDGKKLLEGNTAEITKSFTGKDLKDFADLSGDANPLHLDDAFAKDKGFRQRIVHGALINGLVSCLVGTKLPGHGTVVARELLEFPAPLYVGEIVTATVTITSVRKSLVTCSINCTTKEGKEVMRGEAKLVVNAKDAK